MRGGVEIVQRGVSNGAPDQLRPPPSRPQSIDRPWRASWMWPVAAPPRCVGNHGSLDQPRRRGVVAKEREDERRGGDRSRSPRVS